MERLEIKNLKLSEIVVSKFNPRKHFDEKKMIDLTSSVREKGVIVPIIVREVKGKYELVCGERRFRASKNAGRTTIPVIAHKLTDSQAVEFQVIENLQREDVHPLEEAEGYELIMKNKSCKTIQDIAAKVGKSKAYIYSRMKLCDLIPENRKFFYDDKFSASVALLVARIPKDKQKEAGKIIARGGEYGYANGDPMGYKKAHKYIVENYMLSLKDALFDISDKTLAGKGACMSCLKRTGTQKEFFQDIKSGNTCTDPTCYKEKKQAHIIRTMDAMKKSGKKILSIVESQKLFCHEHSTNPDGKYKNLDDTCYAANKILQYRSLAKRAKDIEIIYAIQPYTGAIIEMVAEGDIPKIFKKLGIKESNSSYSAPITPAERAKNKKANRVCEARRSFWIGKVSAAKNSRCMNVIMLDILLSDIGTGQANKLIPFKFSDGWSRAWSIPKLYDLGDKEVQKLIVKVISKKSDFMGDADLKFLSTKLGFNVAKEFIINETYLKAYTKDGLVKLAKVIGLAKYLKGKKIDVAWGKQKKTDIINLFLKKGFKLQGNVPKEIK